jgi:hypothetical protein
VKPPGPGPTKGPAPDDPGPTVEPPPSGTEARQFDVILPRPGQAEAASGVPLDIPAPAALPEPRALIKALRPLLARAPSRFRRAIDPDRTARRRAEERTLEPVLVPVPERWLDVALVLDTAASMDVWGPTLRDLRRLLERMGAFHRVRTWEMVTDGEGPLIRAAARAAEKGGAARAVRRRPMEVIEPNGRSLVLVVTDCVSAAWYGPAMSQLLADWSRSAAVALLQVLPPRLWPTTAFHAAVAGTLHSAGPGAFDRRWAWEPDWDLGDGGAGAGAVPVGRLDERDLTALARLLAGRGGARVRGYLLRPEPQPAGEAAEPPASGPELVREFRSAASRPAQVLATLLAAAPVISLPVIRLLGEATGVMGAACRGEHLAEVWLGGLLQAVPETASAADPDEALYDFRPGVRDALFDALPRPEARQVLQQVSRYVADNLGRLRGLPALLADPEAREGMFSPGDEPFARIAAQVLQRLGGPYLRLLDRRPAPGTDRPPVRILHLSDLCLDPDEPPPPAVQALPAAVRAWVREGLRPDFVVIAGNLAAPGKLRPALRRARQWIEEELLPVLPGLDAQRVLLVPGRNDVDATALAGPSGSGPPSPGAVRRAHADFLELADAFCPFPAFPAGEAVFRVRGLKVAFARLCLTGGWPGSGPGAPPTPAYGPEQLAATFAPFGDADVRVAVACSSPSALPQEDSRRLGAVCREWDCPLVLHGRHLSGKGEGYALRPFDGGRTICFSIGPEPAMPAPGSAVALIGVDPTQPQALIQLQVSGREPAPDRDVQRYLGVQVIRMPAEGREPPPPGWHRYTLRVSFDQVPPEPDDLRRLPRWALAALAARCARRALTLLQPTWPQVEGADLSVIERAIAQVERSAEQGRPVIDSTGPDTSEALDALDARVSREISQSAAGIAGSLRTLLLVIQSARAAREIIDAPKLN